MAGSSKKQVLIVIAQKNYNQDEFNFLNDLLTQNGMTVTVASERVEKAMGRSDGYVVPHITIEDANTDDYDALIITGGYGTYTSLWDHQELHALVQSFNAKGKLLVGCSVAPVVFANANILGGRKATVFPDYNAAVILQEKGVKHVYESVLTDDNIITSNHPRHIEKLGEVVLSKLME